MNPNFISRSTISFNGTQEKIRGASSLGVRFRYHKPNICAHDYLLKSAWFCVNIMTIPSVSGTAFSAVDGPSRGLSRLAEPPPCLLRGFLGPGGAFGGYVVILLVCHEPIDAHVLLLQLAPGTFNFASSC